MSKKDRPNKPKAATVAIPADPNALKKLRISLGIIIGVFAFLLYAQSITFDYALDDHTVIKDNTITTQGFAGIPTILKTDYWCGFLNELRVPEYRPIPLIMYAIEWQLFPANAHFGHLINVLFYAITCWLLFMLLCILFKNQNLILPFVCSLLYAAHPVHTEVVDNIKSLDEILCFLFATLSIYFIILSIEQTSGLKLIIGILFYFFALLSKESGFVFLLLIPLILFVFTKSTFKRIGIISFLLTVVTCLVFLIRHQVFESLPVNISIESPINNVLYSTTDFLARKATAINILLRYIGLLIFPLSLSCDYSLAQIPIQTFKDFSVILGIVVYSALLIYAIITMRRKNFIAFSILFYLITLAPVSNLFIIIGASMAERFMYIPSLGFCIVLAFVLMKFTKIELAKTPIKSFGQMVSKNSLLFCIIFIITGLYSIRTFSRNQNWKDNYSLYSNDVNVVPNSARMHSVLAGTLLFELYTEEKDTNLKHKYIDKAIDELKSAIKIYNGAPYYFYYLAVAYSYKNDHENALKNYNAAMKIFQDGHIPNIELFTNLSNEYLKANQYSEEISILDSIIKYDPNSSNTYKIKGDALFQLAKYQEAVYAFQKAIELNPKLTLAYRNLGNTYATLQQYPKALDYFYKYLSFDSTDIEVYKYIGMIYQIAGDSINAKQYLEKANKMNGGQQK